MRARSIKPGLYANEDLAECSIWARYIFPGIWMLADREGRLEDRPKKIKGALLPFDATDCDPLLQELADRGFIIRYAVDEQRLIQVVKFSRHQSPHFREAPSKLPPPAGWVQPKPAKPEASEASQDEEAQGGPQAFESLNVDRAPGEAQASLGFAPQRVDLERGPSRADSLTPSSLTPSSLTPSSLTSRKNKPSTSSPAKLPTAPVTEIIELYHEILPDMPKVRLETSDRVKGITKAWEWVLTSTKPDGSRRAHTADQALTWFRDYFTRVLDNDFLMGRTPRSAEHRNWRCDLDFLLTERGMKHVIEKTAEART